MYLWQRRGTEAITGAIAALEQAIDIDPGFVDAVSLLAVATAILHEYSGDDREPDFNKANGYASRALALDSTTSMAHAVKGYIAVRRWHWNESEANFKRALSHDSHEPLVHQWYSNFLNDLGLHELALVHALKAYQADRLSPQANNILALNFLLLGDNESAIKHVSVAREFGLGGAVPDWVEYFVRLREQDYPAAVTVMSNSLRRRKASDTWVQTTVDAIADRSKSEEALAQLSDANTRGELGTSLAFMQYVLLGAGDKVFATAHSQLEDHSLIHLWLFLDEAKPLRDDPRFRSLMKEMAVENYWEQNGYPTVVADLAS